MENSFGSAICRYELIVAICNLTVYDKALHDNMAKLMDFPEIDRTFNGSTIFLSGQKSKYIREGDYSLITKKFPSAEVLVVDGAGHWLHADKPQEFLEIAKDFFTK